MVATPAGKHRLSGSNYDVAPDGLHIAALVPAQGSEALNEQNPVMFLMNSFDELRRRVPVPPK
jgi:hypothetical protein